MNPRPVIEGTVLPGAVVAGVPGEPLAVNTLFDPGMPVEVAPTVADSDVALVDDGMNLDRFAATVEASEVTVSGSGSSDPGVSVARFGEGGSARAVESPTVVALAAPDAPKPIKIFVAGEPIAEIASFSAKTRGVTSMDGQMRGGRGTAHYEFIQGQIDFGSENDPPPRIYLVYNDGRTEVFKGPGFSREGLRQLVYFNAGKGLRPEDTVMDESKGDDSRLGQHGHGTSFTLTYLSTIGIPVDIYSNYEGQAWEGHAGLTPSTTGTSERLQVTGQWLGKQSNETRFVVNLPPGESREMILDRLETLHEYFVYANPRFPGSVVEPDPLSPPPKPALAMSIDKGRIMCLRGIVSWDDSTDKKTIYIDGLQASESRGERHLFPWFVRGFRDYPKEAYTPLKLSRSSDSGSAEGNSATHIAIALRHCTDRAMLSELIDAAVAAAPGKDEELPVELRPYGTYGTGLTHALLQLDPRTAELLANLWREKHGDALVTNEEWVEKDLAARGDVRVVRVRGTLYEWLKEAGIGDGKDAAKFKRTTVQIYDEFNVDYADLPIAPRLERLMTEAVAARGKVKMNTVDGVKVLQILFPIAFLEQKDLSSSSKHGVKWVRAAAIIAKRTELNLSVKSGEGHQVATVNIRSTNNWNDQVTMDIDLSTVAGASEAPYLLVTISGDAIQALAPPPSLAQHLEDTASDALRALMDDEAKRSAALPQVPSQILTALERLDAARHELERRESHYREELEQEYQRRLDELYGQRKALAEDAARVQQEGSRLEESRRQLDEEFAAKHAALAEATAREREIISRERRDAEIEAERRMQTAVAREDAAAVEAARRIQVAEAEKDSRMRTAAEEEARVADEIERQRRDLKAEADAGRRELAAEAARHQEQAARDAQENARRKKAAEESEKRLRALWHSARVYTGRVAALGMIGLGLGVAIMKTAEELGLDEQLYAAADSYAAQLNEQWVEHQSTTPPPLPDPPATTIEKLNGPEMEQEITGSYHTVTGFLTEKHHGQSAIGTAKSPDQISSGYYLENVTSIPYINPLTQRLEWGNHEVFNPVDVPQIAPASYAHFLHRPLYDTDRPPVHLGEVIVGVVSSDGTPIKVEREARTGVYQLTGSSPEVTVYTAISSEPLLNTAPPIDEEMRHLINASDLDIDWQTLFDFIAHHPELTHDERAALVLNEWAKRIVYPDKTKLTAAQIKELDSQNLGTTVSEVLIKIANTHYHECDGAAAGVVGPLRLAGVPARLAHGLNITAPTEHYTSGIAHHVWLQFWNGTSWIDYEEQQNIFSASAYSSLGDVSLGDPRLYAGTDLQAVGALLMIKNADVIATAAEWPRLTTIVGAPNRIPTPPNLWNEVKKGVGWTAAGAGLVLLLRRRTKAAPSKTPPESNP